MQTLNFSALSIRGVAPTGVESGQKRIRVDEVAPAPASDVRQTSTRDLVSELDRRHGGTFAAMHERFLAARDAATVTGETQVVLVPPSPREPLWAPNGIPWAGPLLTAFKIGRAHV